MVWPGNPTLYYKRNSAPVYKALKGMQKHLERKASGKCIDKVPKNKEDNTATTITQGDRRVNKDMRYK